MTREQCHVCGRGRLIEWNGFERLCRVTSDCRPWLAGGRLGYCDCCGVVQKPVNEAWAAEAAAIYSQYSLYYQSNTIDQLVFGDDGTTRPKYEWITDRLARATDLIPRSGTILDVGCGRGAFLQAFAKSFGGWSLTGCDLREENRAEIEAIGQFYSVFLHLVPGQYDLVSLSHVLEHVENPVAFLRQAAAKVRPGGKVFIQVPNLAENPYDTLVADHCSHFTHATLSAVAAAAGLQTTLLATDWVRKEISLVCQVADPTSATLANAANVAAGAELMAHWRDYLLGIETSAKRTLATTKTPFGIFGTAIAAVWLDNQLDHRPAFFIDEDPGRINKLFLDRPVYRPADAPTPCTVFVPMTSAIARTIAARCQTPGMKFLYGEH